MQFCFAIAPAAKPYDVRIIWCQIVLIINAKWDYIITDINIGILEILISCITEMVKQIRFSAITANKSFLLSTLFTDYPLFF